MATIDVFVLEDDKATRESLVRKVESADGLGICGSADCLDSARRQLLTIRPTVLLVDLQLPDGDGSQLIAEYTARHPEIPILVISVFGDEHSVIRALGAGAQGYLLKDDAGEDLADSIRHVVTGQSPISPAIATHLIKRFQPSGKNGSSTSKPAGHEAGLLSARELEVLQLASKGLTYQEAATTLNVSVNTIGTYTRRVYTKLAVSSRAEALFEARQLGLMDAHE